MSSQYQLLRTGRLAPLFATQFFGAFNDNIFRAALMLIFTYSGIVASEMTDFSVNAAAGLFIVPFFIFSATAGQIADKYEKSKLIRIIKICEIGIAFVAGVALYFHNVLAMLSVLFLFGLQSTFFGPLKFAILPQHLEESELVGGNAIVEMGTFVAILLGTVVGGIIGAGESVSAWLFVLVVAVALVGYASSRFIPDAPANDPSETIRWNPVTETWALIKLARGQTSVFLSILGVSWFWLLGSVYLTQIPNLVRTHLAGGPSVVTLILAVFTISIAAGSLMCERLSGRKIEIGLVPFAAFGVSVFGIDSYFAMIAISGDVLRDAWTFLGETGTARLLIDLALMGMFGGMFVIPMQALIQVRTPQHRRARVIAVNNVMNALFIVIGATLAIVWLTLAGGEIPQLLLTVAIVNFLVAIYIFKQVPEFTMRFLIWLLSHTMYRVTHHGLETIPDRGGAIIVCNHVSFVDALLLAGAVRRPIRFVMFKPIFEIPVLNFVFRTGRAIPIIGRREDEAVYEAAFKTIRDGLRAGDLLCIFPEGKLTTDGEIDRFRPGIERILQETPVPVIPMALKGLWGSFFSHKEGAFKHPSRFWSRVDVVAGPVLPPEALTADALQARVAELRGDAA